MVGSSIATRTDGFNGIVDSIRVVVVRTMQGKSHDGAKVRVRRDDSGHNSVIRL